MRRLNYREIRDRFGRIDASFVRARCELGGGSSEYVVRFYPWWEHPAYLEAVRRKKPWAFTDTRSGAREVTVRPVRPLAFHLTQQDAIEDWQFPEAHSALWEYEQHGHITCNSDFSQRDLIDRLVARGVQGLDRSSVHEFIDERLAYRAPYSLGYLPRSVFQLVRDTLLEMGVEISVQDALERPLPKLFLINETDYIVADDFDIDWPEFEHRDEWFAEEAAPAAGGESDRASDDRSNNGAHVIDPALPGRVRSARPSEIPK